MKNTHLAWFLGICTALMLCRASFATDFALNPARDFGAIRRINPTDYNGYAVVRENGAGLSSGTAAAFRAALEVFSKAEAEPAGAVATHAGLTAAHGATGAVVGTTNTQSLTNKTLTDASNHISGSVIDSGVVADANIASTIARDSELASAMSAANASDALNLRLDGSRAMTGSLKFSDDYGIFSNTSDGTDNKRQVFGGGGSNAVSRGSFIVSCGNEYATYGGSVLYYAGNVSSGDHIFYTGAGTEQFRIGYNGIITSPSTVMIGSTTAAVSSQLAVNSGKGTTGGSGFSLKYNSDITEMGEVAMLAHRNNKWAQLYLSGVGNSLSYALYITGTKPNVINGGNLLLGTTTDDGTNKLQVNGGLAIGGTAPASAGASGVAGSIRYDANYIYVCVAANTWKRVAIATW